MNEYLAPIEKDTIVIGYGCKGADGIQRITAKHGMTKKTSGSTKDKRTIYAQARRI